MQDFKKALLCSSFFVCLFLIISIIIIEPFMCIDYFGRNDYYERQELAGTVDELFVGASQASNSFIPEIYNNKTKKSIYNLSGYSLAWYGKEELLKTEIKRNHIKKVYLEISYDALTREYYNAEGDLMLMPRLGSAYNRLKFLIQNISPSYTVNDLSVIYSTAFQYYLPFLSGQKIDYSFKDDYNRGFVKRPVNELDDIKKIIANPKKYLNSEVIEASIVSKNEEKLYEIVNFCKSKGIEICFVVVPVSDCFIYEVENWADFENEMKAICKLTDCELLDFNLLKERYTIFSDKISFTDKQHMSELGANSLTEVFSEIINRMNTDEDISNMFYSSYEEMKNDSPYMKNID